ncbi:MAG: adenylyltransferase/cytidyltransferase family protein [Candidatus Riflebacteria bacterium]|nr:adenylyltransferase/cytidyltransferase family protein [Candidatus Riflebacteria bacterium]
MRDPEEKILTIKAMAAVVESLHRDGKRVCLCHGEFDLVHPGHIMHLRAARQKGDALVVTITPDRFVVKGPGRPVFNEALRARTLAALECVDFVAINDRETAVETIRSIKPRIYVKGSEYRSIDADITGRIAAEKEAVESVGGELQFTDEETFSASTLANRHYGIYPPDTAKFLKEFRARYDPEEIIRSLESLEDLRVLVVGEAIIDEYHYVSTMGKSSKEPILTTRFEWGESFAGGALATANHVAGFCPNVDLITCLGARASQEEFVRSRLKPTVKPKFFFRQDAETIVKRRFVEKDFLNKIFEICLLNDSPLDPALTREICGYLEAMLDTYDLVVVADFGHGMIGARMVGTLCDRARFLAVNTQRNSANLGFNLITKYPRADYVCIDEPEIRLAAHDRVGSLEELVLAVSKSLSCQLVTITLGRRGAITYRDREGYHDIPVLSTEVVDTVGAGDAVLAITAPCAARGFAADLVGFIGNSAGALAVKIVGNRSSVEPVTLYKFMRSMLK